MKITPQAADAIAGAWDETRDGPRENGPAFPDYRALLEMAVEALEKVVARADEAISCLPKKAQVSALAGGGFVFPLDNDTAMIARSTIATIKAELDGSK